MPDIGRDGLLKSAGPLYGRPNRLSWEARRNVRMIETGLFLSLGLLYARVNQVVDVPTLTHASYVASTVVGMVGGVWARRRLLARAAWLEATDRWWERLDEMPHIVPFPRLQQLLSGVSVRPSRVRHLWGLTVNRVLFYALRKG